MSLTAIREVQQAQEKAEAFVAEKTAEARALLSDAESRGRDSLAAARGKAQDEHAKLMLQADEEAERDAQDVAERSRQSCEKLKAEVRGKIPQAVDLVVGRIVSS